MKTFKRSKTSQAIGFSKQKVTSISKKVSNAQEKFEQNISFLSSYIKQNLEESILKQEKKNKENKIKTSIDVNNVNNLNLNMNFFDFGTIKYILNKIKRTPDELLIIKTYLSSMSFLSTLKIPICNDKLLYSLSLYLKTEKKSQNTILFRYGNKGNKFYIILEGEVSILILKETKALISFKRYFLHLLLLKMLKEDELIKKTIIANSKLKFHFDDKDFDGYYGKIVNFSNKYFDKNGYLLKKYQDNENINENENNLDDSENKENSSNISKPKRIVNFVSSKIYDNINDNKVNDKDKQNNIFNKKNVIYTSKIINFNNENNLDNNINNNIKGIRLMDKRKTTRAKQVDTTNLLKNENFRKKEINYNHLDLPYFEIHEIKEIIQYYNFLKDGIEKRKKNFSVNEYIKNTYLDSSFHMLLANEQFSKKDLMIIFQYFEITKKKVGESFGELALQREDNKRTGTVMISKNSILGYLSRNDYNSYLGEIEVKRRKNDINFIISFAIFDKMNRNMFENRYFNYFKREPFLQGQTIIVQDKKINKIFFIKEGQYEITTDLSLDKIYSILQYKTKKKIDDNKKIKIKNQNFNMRLYICYNKDILGLEDCCFKDDISFITARCISSKGVAFTIEKSILNEIQLKIPDIENKINLIKEKREQVMIDRLMNIYYRIAQTNKKSKNDIKKNQIETNRDTSKYIDYLFGLNKNKKNNEFKILSSKTNKNRINSALPLNKRKMGLDIINNNINNSNYNMENNDNDIISKDNKYETMDCSKQFISNSSKMVYMLKNNNLNENIEINTENRRRTMLPKNRSQNFHLKINKNFFNNEEIKNINKEENKLEVINNNKNNKKEEKIPLIKNKISEIMSSEIGIYKSKDKKLVLKASTKLNRISNRHTKKKFINLYSPINKIISNEYSSLINWLDTHQSINNAEKKNQTHNLSMNNNMLLKSTPIKKYYILKNKNYNKNCRNINKRPISYINSKKEIIFKEKNEFSTPRKILSKDDNQEGKNESPKISLYKNTLLNSPNKNYNKKIISQIISGETNPIFLKNNNDENEKYLKQILGTRYKNHFISYEEEKLVKLIKSYNIQDKFLNKRKVNKLENNNLDSNTKYKILNKYRAASAKVKINTKLLKK